MVRTSRILSISNCGGSVCGREHRLHSHDPTHVLPRREPARTTHDVGKLWQLSQGSGLSLRGEGVLPLLNSVSQLRHDQKQRQPDTVREVSHRIGLCGCCWQ